MLFENKIKGCTTNTHQEVGNGMCCKLECQVTLEPTYYLLPGGDEWNSSTISWS